MPHGRPLWILAAATAAAVIIRISFVFWCAAVPGFEWIDPDGYLNQGRLFADGHVFEAMGYRDFLKAPLNPVVLGLFARTDHYAMNAALAHAVLGGAATLGVFVIARSISTVRLGLIAAIAWAVYYPSVMSLMAIRQEHVFIPLLIGAFAMLVLAWQRRSSLWAFAAAGGAFGLASLARSMPAYFVVVAAIWVAWRGERGARVRLAGAFIGGFVLVAGPYVAWVSAQAGQFIFIENIGSFGLARTSPEGRAYFGDQVPSMATTVAYLWDRFTAAPMEFLNNLWTFAFVMFRAPGGPWLEQYALFDTSWQAWLAKGAAHVCGDAVLIIAALLAPFGLVRRGAGDLAWLLGLWIGILLSLTVISGWGNLRYREPIDFALFALAASALAGGASSLSWRRAAAAGVLLVPLVAGFSSSLAVSFRARATYGIVEWIDRDPRRIHARVRAASGLHVTSPGERLEIELTADAGVASRMTVWIDGREIGALDVDATPRTITVTSPPRRAFVELTPADAAAPAGSQVVVVRFAGR